MLKNIFKAAKKLLKNPIVQLGIGAFVPGLAAGMAPGLMRSVLTNPALLQGGIGLLSGDKPENVARNIGIQALLGGFRGMQDPSSTFGEGFKNTFRSGTTGTTGRNIPQGGTASVEGGGPLPTLGGSTGSGGIENLITGAPEKILDFIIKNPVKAAELGLLATSFIDGLDDPRLQDVDPKAIEGLDFSNFQKGMDEARFQARGGIAGYEAGGEKMTSIGINGNTGEPSGLVTGPGTGTSDSIRFVSSKAKVPTDISNGEFIITKEATDKIGPENLYALQTAFDKDAETFEEGQERMAMV
jgi:hypothetical protein